MKLNACKRLFVAALTTSMLGGFAVPALAAAGEDAVSASEESDPAEIIVSARRRSESLQTTPVAITAISGSQLQGAAALTIGDLQGAAPNVIITSGGTGAAAANISIRGIAFADIEKSFDPAVGVNIDGVYIGTSTGQMLDFFDIESIEVLRGPQGTLFGRNTIAGVINVKRSRPTGELGGKMEAEFGSYGRFSSRNVLNAPIVADVLAAKAFYMYTQSDGYYRDVANADRKRGGSKSQNFGASLLFTPSSSFDALLTVDRQVQNFDPVLGTLSQTGDVFPDLWTAFGLASPDVIGKMVDQGNTKGVYNTASVPGLDLFGHYRSWGVTNEMNLDLGAVKLTSVTSYRESTDNMLQDYATIGLYVANRNQKYHQFSQELRASGKIGDGFDYVAGVYYFNSKYNLLQYTVGVGDQDTTGWSESFAGFIDLNWQVADKVRISGGGRLTHDKKALATSYIDLDPTSPDTSFVGPKASHSWSKFTPKIGIDYRPNNDLMLYASWSRGYRSGGFNGRGLSLFAATTPYDPETVDAYEVGIKSELFDRKLVLNLAGFYSNYKNIQQTSTTTADNASAVETIVINAAAAKIKGFEADLTLRAIDRLTIRGSFGYTDASFRGFVVDMGVGGNPNPTTTFDFSGVNMIYAPKITASISGDYTIPFQGRFNGEIKLNASYRYLSRYDQQIAADPAIYPEAIAAPAGTTVVVPRNDPRLRSDEQNLLDLSVSAIFDVNARTKARLTGFVRNVLDDRGTQTAFNATSFPVYWGFATAREPRVFGVQMGLEF
ncbi:MAG: TonB-dependent receptor [Novosphingobium sp.]|jgi:iron complex outermembrane receptor protein|nr:TonB-dependent receptor [Novosphingobium sp.]